MDKSLKLDVENRKLTASYTFITPPIVLKENYGEAVACMRSMERRLIKQGNLEHFNKNFQEIIDRGAVLRNRAILPRFRFRVPNFLSTVPVPTLKF